MDQAAGALKSQLYWEGRLENRASSCSHPLDHTDSLSHRVGDCKPPPQGQTLHSRGGIEYPNVRPQQEIKKEKGTGQQAQHLFPNPPIRQITPRLVKGRGQKFSFSSVSTEGSKFPLLRVKKWRISSLLTAAFDLSTYSWFSNCSHGTWVTWCVCQDSLYCKPNSKQLKQNRELTGVQGLILFR